MFGFEGGEGLCCGGLFFGGFFDGVDEALEVEGFFVDAICFGGDGVGEGGEFFVEPGEFSSFGVETSLCCV